MKQTDKIPVAAIDELLDYIYFDGKPNCEERYEEAGRPRDHIFRSVRRVTLWLDRLDKAAREGAGS